MCPKIPFNRGWQSRGAYQSRAIHSRSPASELTRRVRSFGTMARGSPPVPAGAFWCGKPPNPFANYEATNPPVLPLIDRILPVLALTLSGIYHTPRRAVELLLQSVSSALHSDRRQTYLCAKAIMDEFPDAPDDLLQRLDQALNPDLNEQASIGTLSRSLKLLGVDDTLIVHPQCQNHDCGHVFYGIQRSQDFRQMLPIHCPACQTATRDEFDSPNVLYFARRPCNQSWSTFSRSRG